jgi:hypothetical protein
MFLLHFFVLIQRNEAKKNQGKPDRSAHFARLIHTYFKPQTTNIKPLALSETYAEHPKRN